MDFAIDMGWGGAVLLVVGSIVFAIALQLIGETRFGYEWVITSIGAFVGAVAGTEFFTGLRTFQPTWDGVALLPALAAGVVLAVIVDLVVRYETGGSLVHRGRPI
jgi:uncharacterized membrane protein YeaQ/YmgE (transglycosylase-associated protein family)